MPYFFGQKVDEIESKAVVLRLVKWQLLKAFKINCTI